MNTAWILLVPKMRRFRDFVSVPALLSCLLLGLSFCTQPSESIPINVETEQPAPAPLKALQIPTMDYLPDLSAVWISLLKEKEFPFPEAGYTTAKVGPPFKILDIETLMKQSGNLLRISLSPPASDKMTERLSWSRILSFIAEEMKTIKPEGAWSLRVEDSSLFKSDLGWKAADLKKTKRYFSVASDKSNSELGRNVCAEIGAWVAAAQLLEGRFEVAQSRDETPINLKCTVGLFSSPLETEPFLNVGGLPLPIALEESNVPIFREISDLENIEKLKIISPDSF